MFVQTWRHPPIYDMAHRPSIARVVGDRVILDGTTIEEIQGHHRKTLKVVVEKVNQDYVQLMEGRHAEERGRAQQKLLHRDKVRRIAEEIRFDQSLDN